MPPGPAKNAWELARANRLKAQLIAHLGGQCALCGSTVDLEINHIYVRDWVPRRVNFYKRVLRYWREARAGLVNCLCSKCNSVYKPLPMPTDQPPTSDPF